MNLRNAIGTGVVIALTFMLATSAPPAVAARKTPPLVAWCHLKIGQSKAAVESAMGKPHGSMAASLIREVGGSRGSAAEWDVGSDILLATFLGPHGATSNLQSYHRAIGPIGATDIKCAPFRHR